MGKNRKSVLNQCVRDAILHPHATSIKFNKGHGHITSQYSPPELGKNSLYQSSYLGKPQQDSPLNYSTVYSTSVAGGACMPDPTVISGTSMKLKTIMEGLDETNERLRKTISNFQNNYDPYQKSSFVLHKVNKKKDAAIQPL